MDNGSKQPLQAAGAGIAIELLAGDRSCLTSPAAVPAETPNLDPSNHRVPLFYVTGLPRSGSTLLMNLLAQHPRQHATPTSGLVDMVVAIRNQWMHNVWFKAEGLERVKPKVIRMLRGMMVGFHQEALDRGEVVFNKSRGWLAYIELLEEVFEQPVKMIVTVRDVKAILASFEKIHRREPLTKHVPLGEAYYQAQTTEGRARQLLAAESVVGLSINLLRDALQRGLGDRLVILPYRQLTSRPQQTLQQLHRALGLLPFEYDPENVEQLTFEDDSVHGMDLHRVRRRVEPPAEAPWVGVLPEPLCARIDQEYADINQLANA